MVQYPTGGAHYDVKATGRTNNPNKGCQFLGPKEGGERRRDAPNTYRLIPEGRVESLSGIRPTKGPET